MATTYSLVAPGEQAGWTISLSNGNSYTASNRGVITGVLQGDLSYLLNLGCQWYAPQDFRNLLDGGDFTLNPWQRGSSFTAITSTATYTADRWWAVGGASSAVNVANSSITTLAGFNNALRFARSSGNSSIVPIWFGQLVENLNCYRAQGQPLTLSFWAQSLAGFSTSSISIGVNSGISSTNESISSMMASSWSSFSSIVSSTQTITSAWTRYSFTGNVPNNCTEIGIQIGFTSGATSSATDGVLFAGIQLEIGPGATDFERLEASYVFEDCLRYAWQINEPSSASSIVSVASGFYPTSSTQTFFIPTPVTMRTAPTVTVSSGTWVVSKGSSTSSGTISSGPTHTPNALTINFNATGGTQGQGCLLLGGSSAAGFILASADL